MNKDTQYYYIRKFGRWCGKDMASVTKQDLEGYCEWIKRNGHNTNIHIGALNHYFDEDMHKSLVIG